ncbi:helix-turn-helix domain-containing protein [Methylosinus sporium]|uniref:Helix-turn-helix domain-containing protein n=1 Tax=Methylosinus sporium TaxID=428 RepID=A0A549T1A6_METSR|nr:MULTISPECIES: AraC family transcriptional regulator [Methylosinus]MBU3888775.1 AraC family transcriptional regulator [Methylosinus sp. KRF6]TRL35665.1 helix-turn-helix domain-containing protein [Methylosinus sporium]
MTKTALENYQARMRRVLDHIDRHLDENLSLDILSGVAAFSKHHFHRQFGATFGMSAHRYVQLARMKRASYRLAFRHDANVTEIALDAGYEAPDAFARAFRECVGQAPSAFRKSPDWESWLAALEPLDRVRSAKMTYSLNDVTVREFPATPVAILTHRGDPGRVYETVRRFIDWRRAAGLGREIAATFTTFPCDPRTTPLEEFRLDLCAATNRPIEANALGVTAGLLPGGRCAVLRVIGSSENLERPALFLYRDWLPASGEEPRDFPLFCQRIGFYPDAPEHETITDLFLPII